MKLLNWKTSLGLLAAGAAITLLSAGGVALASHHAGHVTLSGGTVLATKIQTSIGETGTNSQSWVKLTGSSVDFNVVNGTTRLFDARFHGAPVCVDVISPNVRACFVRIVAENLATGSIIQLHPRGDFVFDSTSSEGEVEALGIERSIRLGPGSYRFYVQVRTQDSTTELSLEGWHFAVERHT
jgi:hypothetical protein